MYNLHSFQFSHQSQRPKAKIHRTIPVCVYGCMHACTYGFSQSHVAHRCKIIQTAGTRLTLHWRPVLQHSPNTLHVHLKPTTSKSASVLMGKSLNFFLGWVRARARAPLIGSKTDTGGARARARTQPRKKFKV